jgi:hypothetical protein
MPKKQISGRVTKQTAMPVCDVCKKFVGDLRKHKARGRCKVKGKRRSTMPARFMPGTPENRLRQDSGYGGWA